MINGERVQSAFHATCARMAGLEVGSTDDGAEHLYGKWLGCSVDIDGFLVRQSHQVSLWRCSEVLPSWRK